VVLSQPQVRHALDELHLVWHYCDEALLYNTLPGAPEFDFAAVASRVANVLANDHGVFNRIFLFNPYDARKVLQVYPVGTEGGVGKQASLHKRAAEVR